MGFHRLLLPAGLLVMATLVSVGLIENSARSEPACPDRPHQVPAQTVHFVPGLERHQSWVEFAVPEPDATDFILCLDGRVQSIGGGHTPVNGIVRVSIATGWVDLEWAAGRLAQVEIPSRWQLRYTTYRLKAAQTR